MKKLSLFLVVFLVLASFAFAQEEEAAASPLTATGSLSFSLGDSKAFEDTTTDLPIFSSTKAATATLGLATADEKVSGTVSVNLLAPVSVATTASVDRFVDLYNADTNKVADDYVPWIELQAYGSFWNDHAADEIAAGTAEGDSIWDTDDDFASLLTTVNTNTDFAEEGSTADTFSFFTALAPESTADDDDEFVWSTAIAGEVNTANTSLQGDLDNYVARAKENIINSGSDDLAAIVATPTGDIAAQVNDATVVEIDDLSADDIALLKQALDLESAYGNVTADAATEYTSKVTQTFVTAATLSLNQIGGVVDATFLFGGQHVSAGSINVDGSGHTSTAVKAYHGMTLGLSSGVVEGANASLGVYIDDNGVKASASDDIGTWDDESQDVVDPKYGMTLGGGYSTSFGDLTAGGNLAFGLYDLLGTPAWAVSVMPSVSGMGGSADIEIAYGLDLFYTKAALSYAIMGITPTATIHYINEMDGNSLAYAKTPTSVLAELKNAGGFGADLGLGVDLGQFLPVASSINAGLDLGFPTGGEMAMAWSAGLSVTPLTGLTASASFSGDEVAGNFMENINWSTGLSYAYGVATVSASVGQSYSAATGAATSSWSIGTSVSF